MFVLNIPYDMVLQYGYQAGCQEKTGGPVGCNFEAGEIQHAQTVIVAMCAISILGGLSGVWGAWTKDEQAGLAVWLVLVLASAGVAYWNLQVWLSAPHGQLQPFASPAGSLFWFLAHAAAYFWWWRHKPD